MADMQKPQRKRPVVVASLSAKAHKALKKSALRNSEGNTSKELDRILVQHFKIKAA